MGFILPLSISNYNSSIWLLHIIGNSIDLTSFSFSDQVDHFCYCSFIHILHFITPFLIIVIEFGMKNYDFITFLLWQIRWCYYSSTAAIDIFHNKIVTFQIKFYENYCQSLQTTFLLHHFSQWKVKINTFSMGSDCHCFWPWNSLLYMCIVYTSNKQINCVHFSIVHWFGKFSRVVNWRHKDEILVV